MNIEQDHNTSPQMSLTKEQIEEWCKWLAPNTQYESANALCSMAMRTEQAERESSERLKALLAAQERIAELEGELKIADAAGERLFKAFHIEFKRNQGKP